MAVKRIKRELEDESNPIHKRERAICVLQKYDYGEIDRRCFLRCCSAVGVQVRSLYVAQPGKGVCFLNSRATHTVAGNPSMGAPLMSLAIKDSVVRASPRAATCPAYAAKMVAEASEADWICPRAGAAR